MIENMTEQEYQAMNQQFRHALAALQQTHVTLGNSGINPGSLASAICASYVSFVAASAAFSGAERDTVIQTCREALEMMQDYANHVFDSAIESMKEENAA